MLAIRRYHRSCAVNWRWWACEDCCVLGRYLGSHVYNCYVDIYANAPLLFLWPFPPQPFVNIIGASHVFVENIDPTAQICDRPPWNINQLLTSSCFWRQGNRGIRPRISLVYHTTSYTCLLCVNSHVWWTKALQKKIERPITELDLWKPFSPYRPALLT